MMKRITDFFKKILPSKFLVGSLYLIPLLAAGQMLEDIDIEEDHGGAMIADVIHVNDRLIACSPSNLFEYNDDGTVLINSFDISADGKSYGKFAPRYFSEDGFVPGAKILAYNSEAEVIYVVSTDLTVQGFGFTSQGNIESLGTIISRPAELNHMKVLHGFSILKYDEAHKRLYWVVQGKNHNESIYQFHVREVFLGIYKMDVSGKKNYEIHREVNSLDGDPPEDYLNAIHDIAFLDVNDHYYLARLQRVDVFNIHETQPHCTVELVHQYPMRLGKIGKLLYVDEIDKVLAFPFRLPFLLTEPPPEYQVKIYIMDVNNYSMDSCNSPDKRIYDAVYLPNRLDLIMCRNPVIDENYGWIHEEDIAVYHWTGDNFTYDIESDLINTNGFPDAEEPNTPIRMLQIGNDGVLISKKHEVVYLYYAGNSYNFCQKHSSLNNIFSSGTKSNDISFIINMVNNGFERFDSNLDHIDSIRTASPIYQIVGNGPYDRLFFFHTLNSYGSGIYMYNGNATFNLNEINEPSERIDKPVGDCIFNPYKNQMLVSMNAPAESYYGEIKCYDATSGQYEESIFLAGNGYCKEMFLAPNGYLYLTTNMKENYTGRPVIFILNAKNYSTLNGATGQMISPIEPSTDFKYYTADFCYNPYNDRVYATIKPQENISAPYTTDSGSRDTLIFKTDPQDDPNGWFLILNTEIIAQNNTTFVNPGKILCRTPLSGNVDNQSGYIFILSNKFTIYDCDSENFHHSQSTYTDMSYSRLYDRLYVLWPGNSPNNGDDFDLLKLGFNGTSITVEDLSTGHPGYAGAIFMNNYDNMLYVYHKLDKKMLGELSTRLIKIDPVSGSNSIIELGDSPFYGFYPEVLQKSQTPAIDPYSNTMFIPNGAHSTVSRVGFAANEALYLEPGYNWMSVPRHTRPTDPEWTLISSVFDQTNFKEGYNQLELNYYKADPENSVHYFARWSPQRQWNYDPDYDDSRRTFSIRGYGLDLFQPETGRIMMMKGEVESLNTSTELYCLDENWIGYYIYEEQNVFNALSKVADHLYHIKHQDYECWRYNYPIPNNCREKSMTDFSPGTWICNGRPVIKYGEMIKVKPVIDITDFEWEYTGSSPFDCDRREVEYYQYEKTADYTTMVIELDTTGGNPMEIGAFVNDTCVGACRVMEEDSVVVLSAYLGVNPGDSVVFEEYYGNTKQSGRRISEYVVMDQRKFSRQKRAIRTGEGQDVYIVSFLPDTGEQIQEQDDLTVHIYPNPASGRIFIDYEIGSASMVNIEVFDVLGRKIEVLSSQVQYPGKYQVVCDGSLHSELSSVKGLYLVKVSTPQSRDSCKVILH